ncbi:MAG: hypothetical protein KatS3mg061_1750 [Dehalococcoidia bacterium]|nr:MAG: hypothetical protein KatS3mg061_1750 [Dehalococcoidia bacterium]
MRWFLLRAVLVLTIGAAVFFAGNALLLEATQQQARVELRTPTGPSQFKVIETVTRGRALPTAVPASP